MVRNLLILFICGVFAGLMTACKESNNVRQYNIDEGLTIRINSPAGEITDHISPDFIPPPFNLGELQNNKHKFVVLSDRMNNGRSVKVKPIAIVELTDTMTQTYIISIPTDKNDQIIQAQNFGMLATNYPEVKNMIEYWLTASRKGLHTKVNWKSEQLSLDLVE